MTHSPQTGSNSREFCTECFCQIKYCNKTLSVIYVENGSEMDNPHRLFLQCFMAKPFMSEQDAKDAYLKCVEAFHGMYEHDVHVQNLAVLNGVMAHCMISRFSTFTIFFSRNAKS